MSDKKYPKSFSHIGITVPDINKAVQFYEEVMGWYIIMPPSKVLKEKETAIGQMCIDVFGDDWEEFEIAHMSTSDGIGVELFSFPHGIKKAPEFNPFNTGLFHFCVQDPDIEGLTKRIVALGAGKECQFANITPGKNHTKWFTWKTRLESYLKFIHIAMN